MLSFIFSTFSNSFIIKINNFIPPVFMFFLKSTAHKYDELMSIFKRVLIFLVYISLNYYFNFPINMFLILLTYYIAKYFYRGKNTLIQNLSRKNICHIVCTFKINIVSLFCCYSDRKIFCKVKMIKNEN